MAIWSSNRRSLRTRIALRIAAGTAAVLVVAGFAIDRVVETALQRDFDRALLARARALATLTELQQGGEYELEFADEVMPEFSRSAAPDFFQIWVDSGRLLERSRSLRGVDLRRESPPRAGPRYVDRALPDGRAGRFVQLDFAPQVAIEESSEQESAAPDEEGALESRTATVIVATSRDPLALALARVRRVTAITFGALLALLSGLGLWAVSAGLAPLGAIARQVAELGPEEPTRRVALADAPPEILPLVQRLNELVVRMAEALERERQLSRDVAHELRTPVAELRALAEVTGRWPDDPAAVRAFAEDARAIALGMERIVAALLSLARAEAGLDPARTEWVEVGAAIEAASRRVGVEARDREIVVVLELAPETAISSDAGRLELLLGNLIENAVLHSPPGSQVRVTARSGGDVAIVEVENPAPGLAPDDLPHLFERFWRKEAARGSGRHAGLGLSLAAALARSLGAELSPRLEDDGRLVMRLALPRGG